MDNQFSFLKPLRRGWIIIVGAMILAYVLSSKYLSYVTPMYESTAKLRLADMNEGVPNSNLYKDFDVFANAQKIQAEIELIKSHAILKNALEKVPFDYILVRKGNLKNTELFNDAPILVSKSGLGNSHYDKPFLLRVMDSRFVQIMLPDGQRIEGNLGDTLRFGNSFLKVMLNETLIISKPGLNVNDDYFITFQSPEKQISEVLKNLDVTSVDKDVPVIRISYRSSHPEKAAIFPNVLAQAYIEDYIQTKYGAANVTSHFLNDRIDEISRKLSGAESAILQYREKNDITNIRQETETDLRKISQLKIQQTNLKMSLDAIRELDVYMEKGSDKFLELAPNFEAFTDLLSTEMIKKIKQLQAEKKDLLLEYTPKDEKVIAIDQKINDISSYLRESIRNTRKNLESKYNNLVNDITRAEQVFIPVPEKERVMTILNREFDIYQQSYNFLNQKKIEAEIAKAAKVAFHRIITPASVSKMPVSPNRVIIQGVAVILGMIAAILLIFLVHSMKARVNDLSTIESLSSIPVAASVPKFKNVSDQEAFFLMLLTQWKVKGLLEPKGMINFTGYHDREGIDFMTREIIQVLTRQGSKLLLISFEDRAGHKEFYTKYERTETLCEIRLNTSCLMFETTEKIQSFLKSQSLLYDYTVVKNSSVGKPYTLMTMDMADVNMICVDTRLTPAKKITEIELLKDEYRLPEVFFAVNRVGYNPGFLGEVIRWVKKRILSPTHKNQA